jgi:VIT1/CCC1 family predicted Fe2+/Mn2+ transporter
MALTSSDLLQGWQHECRSAYLYRAISLRDPLSHRKQLFSALAEEAEKQASLWVEEAAKLGLILPVHYQPDTRARCVSALIRLLGPQRLKPVLAAMKIRGLSIYAGDRKAGFHPLPQSVEEVGASHRSTGNSGGLRAAVFGVNDGLVSIACLVMGVAGAASSNSVILLTGLAGLLAGAFSMAAGEYISMRSQREMFEYQIGLERAELAQYPEEEATELALIYRARGMTEAEAKALADRMMADPEVGLDTLAREELGLNPDDLGSPWLAAISSFLAFMVGGAIPLWPYVVGMAHATLQFSIGFTATGLFLIGLMLSLFTGRNALLGGLRMLLIGGAAGLLTYWVGYWMGVSIA